MSEKERILVADDMRVVHSSLRIIFEIGGHEVVADAYNPDEVEAIVDSQIDFSVACVDGKMPEEGDGARAASYIRAKRPSVKIVSISVDKQSFGDVNLLKDFSARELLNLIRSF